MLNSDIIINGKVYSSVVEHLEEGYLKTFVECAAIFDIISHKGKLYYRPLSLKELEEIKNVYTRL